MTLLEYWINLIVYEWLILLCLAPVLLILMRVFKFLGPLGDILSAIAAILFIACLLGGSWVAREAARKRVFDGQGFLGALGDAFAEARLRISFNPILGRWFGVRPPKRSPFQGPDDPYSR